MWSVCPKCGGGRPAVLIEGRDIAEPVLVCEQCADRILDISRRMADGTFRVFDFSHMKMANNT